jgi:hypothetical protein
MNTPQGLLIPQLQSRLTIGIAYRKGFTVFVNNELASMVKEKHLVHSLQLKGRLERKCRVCLSHCSYIRRDHSLSLGSLGLRGISRVLWWYVRTIGKSEYGRGSDIPPLSSFSSKQLVECLVSCSQ